MAHHIRSPGVADVINEIGFRPFAFAMDLTPEEYPYFRRHLRIESCRLGAFLGAANKASEIVGRPLHLTHLGLVLDGVLPEFIPQLDPKSSARVWWILRCRISTPHEFQDLARLRSLIRVLTLAGFTIENPSQTIAATFDRVRPLGCHLCSRRAGIQYWKYTIQGQPTPVPEFDAGQIVKLCPACFRLCSELETGEKLKTAAQIVAAYYAGFAVLNPEPHQEVINQFLMPDATRRALGIKKRNPLL